MVCVIGLIGEQLPDRAGVLDQLGGDGDVIGVAGRQEEDARPALFVGERVELARPPAAGFAERLLERPPFPPDADRCALIWVLSIAARPYMPLWPVSARKISNQSPCRLQRLNRL
jgi:hypothetical protein